MSKSTNSIYIRIYDIYIKDNNSHNRIPIYEHPYYQSLITNNSHKIYEKYIKQNLFQSNKKTAKWINFIKLYDKIKKDGLDISKSPINVKRNENNIYSCIHGRHRMCMLAHIYGLDSSVKIKNDCVIKVKYN